MTDEPSSLRDLISDVRTAVAVLDTKVAAALTGQAEDRQAYGRLEARVRQLEIRVYAVSGVAAVAAGALATVAQQVIR